VLVSVHILDVPRRADGSRVEVVHLASDLWLVKVSYGFMEQPNLPNALAGCAAYGLHFDPMDTSFFLGRETLLPRLNTDMCRWRGKLFVWMFRNGGSAANFFGLPANRVVELGTQVVM